MRSIWSGMAGALALTAAYQTVSRLRSDAPRMDRLGREALGKLAAKAGLRLDPGGRRMQAAILVGDLLANGLYYSLVARLKHRWRGGVLLGSAAGLGAIVLPGPLGLTAAYATRTWPTSLAAFAMYLLGGLVAAGTARGPVHSPRQTTPRPSR
ncbi:MAG: hypothetical protein AB7I38_03420 [Dehalococcoidia bacterium]